jgi:hypothetical protein
LCETKDAGFETRDVGFATKYENLFALFSILACAWQPQKKYYGRLFTDYHAIIG